MIYEQLEPEERLKTYLENVGVLVFGAGQWKTQMANTLGVNERTMQRWTNGTLEIPDRLAKELYLILEDHNLMIKKAQQLLINHIEETQ